MLVINPDNPERRAAMFKDNKLRLLLTLVGFTRLGDSDDPDATWVIPPSLTSTELQEALDLIRKFEFDPPTYEDGKGPEDMLRRKAGAARQSARRVDWDDSDGIDHDSDEDRGEYALDKPTARNVDDTGRRLLKRRRRARTPIELDDEEKERKAEARRRKEIEKQRKVKSTMMVHSSDEEWDEEKDAEFFAQEEALRAQTLAAFKKSLTLGSAETSSSKKRKADEPASSQTKRRKTPPRKKAGPFESDESGDSGDEGDDESTLSRAQSEEARDAVDEDDTSGDEATDTPMSSQPMGTTQPTSSSVAKGRHVAMAEVEDDEEEDIPIRRPAARNLRAGFVIDSDSE